MRRMPSFLRSANSAVAVKRTSEELLSAVSQASSSTEMMKPTPTTCIEISLPIPNDAQATGIRRSEPPATPDVPHAPIVETMQSRNAVGRSMAIPSVWAAARDRTEIVMDAPAMLMVAPSGMEIVKRSGLRPRRRHRDRLTGILAAEDLVKKAYTPLSRSVEKTSGYGFI